MMNDEWPGVDTHSMSLGIRQSFAYSFPSLEHLELSCMSTSKLVLIEDQNVGKIATVSFVGMPATRVYSFKWSSLKNFISGGVEKFR